MKYAAFAVNGAACAQASLLGLLAAWGSEPQLVRFPRAIFLVALGTLAACVGAQIPIQGLHGGFDILNFIFAIGAIATTFCTSFGVSRVVAWLSETHLVLGTEVEIKTTLRSHQFSLAHLVVWTCAVALLLGLSRLLPASGFDNLETSASLAPKVLFSAFAASLVICIPTSLSLIPSASMMLSDRHDLIGADRCLLASYGILSGHRSGGMRGPWDDCELIGRRRQWRC